MNEIKLPETTVPASVQKVRYTDGMLVTAEDLDVAMRYPVDVFRVLARSFFGCGIVCGLEMKIASENDPGNYLVKISKGVALDCYGNPIELCQDITLDLSPEPCHDNTQLEKLCIAVRLTDSLEQPRPQDECTPNASSGNYQCTRIREQIQIKVFTEDGVPTNTCALPGQVEYQHNNVDIDKLCDCFKQCPDQCCGEGWVLLGCVKRTNCMLSKLEDAMYSRKYVKPIRCICQQPQEAQEPAPCPAPAPAPAETARPQAQAIQQTITQEAAKPEPAKTEAAKVEATTVKAETKPAVDTTAQAQTATAKAAETKTDTKTTDTKASAAKTTTKKTTDKK